MTQSTACHVSSSVSARVDGLTGDRIVHYLLLALVTRMMPSSYEPTRHVQSFDVPPTVTATPLSLHFASEEKQQLSATSSSSSVGSGSSSGRSEWPLFTSRTRYERLTRRLQAMNGELLAHTAADEENARMRRLHARGAITATATAHTTDTTGTAYGKLTTDSINDTALDGSTVGDGLFAAVLTASSHSSHGGTASSQQYTGEALLQAMSRLTQKDSRDDKQDTAATVRRQQQVQQQQQQAATGRGQLGALSSVGRSTVHLQVGSGNGTQQQQHLPIVTGTVSLPPVAVTSGGAVVSVAARSLLSAASVSSSSADSDVWSVGQSAQLSVRAVLDYYRSHPAARSDLQVRVEALRAAKAVAASGAVTANKRSMGQREVREAQSQVNREAEVRRQQAARDRLNQAAAVQAAEAAHRQHVASGAVRDRSLPHYLNSGHTVTASGDSDGGHGGDDSGGYVGASGSGRALLGAGSTDWLDGSGDGASVDRRARSLWLSIALPTATACTVWLERCKGVVIPRLAVELDSDVDVALSGLLHSSLVARLQDSRDAALTVLKRSLASYGQRWQDKRRRKAATLILRFLTLVHTASAIRQALRDTSVLTHILRIQRWWRRHTGILHAQCAVVSKKWRRREAAIARHQQHSSSGGAMTPSGAGGAGGGSGGSVGGQSDYHREATSRDRRRQPSFDARASRHKSGNEQPASGQQQREAASGSSTAMVGVLSSGSLSGASSSDVSSYKAIPRSAQQQAVSHLLAVRRAAHRRRLRGYFTQLAAYEMQYAQQLELIRTRRLLGMETADGTQAATLHNNTTAAAATLGASSTAGHTLALPPAPVRPVFPLVPQNAEMDKLLIAASRSYFLSRLVGFKQDRSQYSTALSHSFGASHREGALDDSVDFTPAFCIPHNPAASSTTGTASATINPAFGNELSRVNEESDSTMRPLSS